MAEPEPRTPVDEYRAAVASIRETAKWVLGTLGAIGAVLVTGLGLSSLVDIDSTLRLVVAILGIVAALGGVAWGIGQTAAVLRPSTIAYPNVVTAEQGGGSQVPGYLSDVIWNRSGLLGGLATSFAELQTKSDTVMQERVQALEAHYADPSDADKAATAQAKQARARLYGQKIDAIVARAAYGEVKSRLSVLRQLLAGGLVAAGVCLFALMLALPTDPPPDFHGATLRSVDLSGTRLVKGDFSGMRLTRVNLREADLREADFSKATLDRVDLTRANAEAAKFGEATWKKTTCPDGTSSDEAGKRCQHHLEARKR